MTPVLLYLLLLKATITSFSGLASLPIIRQDLVVERHVLTDVQLDTAIVVSRTTPGPVGVYVVSVGYLVCGTTGAIAGWLAMCTPAFLIIPLMGYAARRVEHPRLLGLTRAVVVASSALLLSALVPLAHNTLTGVVPVAIAIVGAGLLLARNVEPLWVVLGASVVGLLQAL